jgi:hypothetical protein
MIYQRLAKVFLICSRAKRLVQDIAKPLNNLQMPGILRARPPPAGDGSQLNQVSGMRGIVAFAIMTAILAVIDAAFFKGKYLNDAQEAITGLASISMQLGRR